MWHGQAIIEWSRWVISIVACYQSGTLCALAARAFHHSLQNGAVTRMWRPCQVQPSQKERAIGVVRCKRRGCSYKLSVGVALNVRFTTNGMCAMLQCFTRLAVVVKSFILFGAQNKRKWMQPTRTQHKYITRICAYDTRTAITCWTHLANRQPLFLLQQVALSTTKRWSYSFPVDNNRSVHPATAKSRRSKPCVCAKHFQLPWVEVCNKSVSRIFFLWHIIYSTAYRWLLITVLLNLPVFLLILAAKIVLGKSWPLRLWFVYWFHVKSFCHIFFKISQDMVRNQWPVKFRNLVNIWWPALFLLQILQMFAQSCFS